MGRPPPLVPLELHVPQHMVHTTWTCVAVNPYGGSPGILQLPDIYDQRHCPSTDTFFPFLFAEQPGYISQLLFYT